MNKHNWGGVATPSQNYPMVNTSTTPTFTTAQEKLALLSQLESTPENQGFRPIYAVYLLCGLGIVGSMAFGGIQNFLDSRAATVHIRQQRIDMQVLEQEYVLNEEQARISDAIAKSRYQNGCVFLISPHDKNSFVSINEDGDVVDGITGQPIASGTTVCDPNGGTAIVNSQGKATSYAFTGDPIVVDEAAIAAGYNIHRQADFGNSKQATQ